MEKKESVETLARKYKEIFREDLYDFVWDDIIDQQMINFLIEFAGAIEHHLSARINVEDGMAKLVENQQDMPPEFIKAVDDNFDELI